MSRSTSETGHYKNVANFKALISFCTELGNRYQPSRNELTINELETKHQAATETMDKLMHAQIDYSKAVVARSTAFDELKQLCTRVMNTLEACNPSSEVNKMARLYITKIAGKRVKAITPPADATTEAAPKQRSVSQTSYDARLNNFEQLVRLAGAESMYQPNEADLTTQALQNTIAHLTELNHAVTATQNKQKLLIAERQEALYAPVTGLVPIALSVKKYVKAVFSATSAEAKAAGAIAFAKSK